MLLEAEKTRKHASMKPPERTQLCGHLDFRGLTPEWKRIILQCFKLLSLWEFFYSSNRNLRHPFYYHFFLYSVPLEIASRIKHPQQCLALRLNGTWNSHLSSTLLPKQIGFYAMYKKRSMTSVNPKASLSLLYECKYIQNKVCCPFQNKLFLNFVLVELNPISLYESNIKFSLKFKNTGS